MKILIVVFSVVILLTQNVGAQNDQEAIKILDRFSSGALSAPSVSMKFDLVTIDHMEETNDTLTGSIILCKNKYKLELTDNITWFNGETSWSYLPAEKEVTITRADKKDNSFQNRPSAIFSMYKNGFKCRLIEERSNSYIIDLYPEDIKSDLVRVRLSVGMALADLRSIEYKRRDGIVITLHVREYNLKVRPDPETFIFQPAKNKGVEVIDMR